MNICLIKTKATKKQIESMLKTLRTYIKLAVDVEQCILVGGGELHADCESVLIENGSKQDDIWGANWIPTEKKVTFEALLNIAPRRNNRSMEIQNPKVRALVETTVRNLLDIE